MTQLLEKAFEEAEKLSEEQQNELANWILDELKSEQKWNKSFESSQDALSQLANEALSEFREGKTKTFDPEKF